MEDVIETMIGKLIMDEFDHYDDLRAVAARAAKKDHQTRREPARASSVTEDTKAVK